MTVKEKRLQKGEVGLLLLYILLFVDFILSVCWGGFGPTGGGYVLPNSQILIPMMIFTVGTSVQVAYGSLAKKTNVVVNVILTWVKYLFMIALALWTTWYMFVPDWIGEIDFSDFHSSIYATLISGIFYVLVAACIVTELALAGCLAWKKREREISTKKKVGKLIVALVLVVSLVTPVVFAILHFTGSPQDYATVREAAYVFIEKEYGDTDYEVESVAYNYRSRQYTVNIASPTKIDEHFKLWMSARGSINTNNYEHQIVNKVNVQTRLNEEYEQLFQDSKFWKEFGYDCRIRGGRIGVYDAQNAYYTLHENALTPSDLELNKQYDVKALAATNGEISITVDVDKPSYEMVAEMLIELKALSIEKEIPFYNATISLWGQTKEEQISIAYFPYADIYEENLAERLQAHVENKNS